MVDAIAVSSLIAAGLLFALGIVEYVRTWGAREQVASAASRAASVAQETNASTAELEKHAGIDFKGQWEALAALSSALKDLDKSTRFIVLSLAFAGIAGGTLGLDSIGAGLAAG